MRNLHQLFVLFTGSQIIGEDFAKFCGLLRICKFYLVRNIEIQRQRDRQMELSNRAHVQFQEESIEDKEKSKYSNEASRELSR